MTQDNHSSRMADFQLTRINERAESIATSLERLAADVRRTGTLVRVAKDPESVVADIIHTVTWGVANLNVELLVNAAGDYRKIREAAYQPSPDSEPRG